MRLDRWPLSAPVLLRQVLDLSVQSRLNQPVNRAADRERLKASIRVTPGQIGSDAGSRVFVPLPARADDPVIRDPTELLDATQPRLRPATCLRPTPLLLRQSLDLGV